MAAKLEETRRSTGLGVKPAQRQSDGKLKAEGLNEEREDTWVKRQQGAGVSGRSQNQEVTNE